MCEVLLVACAIYDVAFGLFHVGFWRRFDWPGSLGPSGALNAAVTQTLNVMLTYCFFTYAAALAWLASDASAPALLLPLAGAGFWIIRAVMQPTLFPVRSKVSRRFTYLFAMGAMIHGGAALSG